MSRYPAAWFASVAAVAVGLAAALWWVGTLDRSPAVSVATGPPAASVVVASGSRSASGSGVARSRAAVEVLHRWDLARARAYARGDAAGLRSLYVAGSTAGTTDARMLRAYERRGLRVEGIRMQLLEVVVLAHAPGRWRLRVTDRLTGAVAVAKTPPRGGGSPAGAAPPAGPPRGSRFSNEPRLRLPRDEASTRLITLRLRHGSWKVAAVR